MAEPKEIQERPEEELAAELLKLQERANLINEELKRRENEDVQVYQITIRGTYKPDQGWGPETCWGQEGASSAAETAAHTNLRNPTINFERIL